MNLRDAAQQALEFCEFCWRDVALNDYAEEKREAAEAALRAALAEPQPQPDLQDLWREAQQPQWDAAHRQIDADVAAGVLAEMDEIERLQAERDALLVERDALLDKIRGVIAAEQSEGAGRSGFANTPPTREHQRRVARAWQELHTTIAAIDAARGAT